MERCIRKLRRSACWHRRPRGICPNRYRGTRDGKGDTVSAQTVLSGLVLWSWLSIGPIVALLLSPIDFALRVQGSCILVVAVATAAFLRHFSTFSICRKDRESVAATTIMTASTCILVLLTCAAVCLGLCASILLRNYHVFMPTFLALAVWMLLAIPIPLVTKRLRELQTSNTT